MSGVSRILADSANVSHCQLDPLSTGSGCCSPGFVRPAVVTERSCPLPPPPTFAAPPASFESIRRSEEVVRSFIQSQGLLSAVVVPVGKSPRNRRKGAAPKRAASEEDDKPVERKKKSLGVAKAKSSKPKGSKCGGKRQVHRNRGLSAQEAIVEMQRRMASRAAKKSNVPSRKSPAFYRSFPLVFGHNCMQCTA